MPFIAITLSPRDFHLTYIAASPFMVHVHILYSRVFEKGLKKDDDDERNLSQSRVNAAKASETDYEIKCMRSANKWSQLLFFRV